MKSASDFAELEKAAPMKFVTLVGFREADGVAVDDKAGTARVIIITEGLGNLRDRNYYSREAVESCVEVFNGKQFYIDHPGKDDEENRPERTMRDLAGYFFDCQVGQVPDLETGDQLSACFATLKFAIETEPGRLAFGQVKAALEYQKRFPNSKDVYCGISINGGGVSHPDQIGGLPVNMVTEIKEAFSADIVTKPARGGRFMSLFTEAQRVATFRRRVALGVPAAVAAKSVEENMRTQTTEARKEVAAEAKRAMLSGEGLAGIGDKMSKLVAAINEPPEDPDELIADIQGDLDALDSLLDDVKSMKKQAEAARKQAAEEEKAMKQQENERRQAEGRRAGEGEKRTDENERRRAGEGEKRTDEGERRAGENERRAGENERRQAEGERKTDENERRQAEGERRQAEGERRAGEADDENMMDEDERRQAEDEIADDLLDDQGGDGSDVMGRSKPKVGANHPGMDDHSDTAGKPGQTGEGRMTYTCAACASENEVAPPKGYRLVASEGGYATESVKGVQQLISRLRKALESKEARFMKQNENTRALMQELIKLRAENTAFRRLGEAQKRLREAKIPRDVLSATDLIAFEPHQWDTQIRAAKRVLTQESAIVNRGGNPSRDAGAPSGKGTGADAAIQIFKEAGIIR